MMAKIHIPAVFLWYHIADVMSILLWQVLFLIIFLISAKKSLPG